MPPATFAPISIDEIKYGGCGRCIETCPMKLLMLENKKCIETLRSLSPFACRMNPIRKKKYRSKSMSIQGAPDYKSCLGNIVILTLQNLCRKKNS